MNIQFTRKTSNSKTGPIPVTVTSSDSCPSICPLKDSGGCYAGVGPVSWNWRKVTSGERGASFSDVCDQIAILPDATLWRHNVAGDLIHNDQVIDMNALAALTKANIGKRGFTFTHHDMSIPANQGAVRAANFCGFTVNLSANDLNHADYLADLVGGPVAVILPADQMTNTATPKGRKVVVCPAVTKEGVTCQTCGLCAKADRKVIVGFPAHGAQAVKANAISLGL